MAFGDRKDGIGRRGRAEVVTDTCCFFAAPPNAGRFQAISTRRRHCAHPLPHSGASLALTDGGAGAPLAPALPLRRALAALGQELEGVPSLAGHRGRVLQSGEAEGGRGVESAIQRSVGEAVQDSGAAVLQLRASLRTDDAGSAEDEFEGAGWKDGRLKGAGRLVSKAFPLQTEHRVLP